VGSVSNLSTPKGCVPIKRLKNSDIEDMPEEGIKKTNQTQKNCQTVTTNREISKALNIIR